MNKTIISVIRDDRITPMEKMLLILLEVNNGAARLSNAELSDVLNCYSRTAQKLVQSLKQKGFLKSEVLRLGMQGNCLRTLISHYSPPMET